MESRVTGKPTLHFRMFVSGIVIDDQMEIFFRRRDPINHTQELQPLLMAMPVVAHADHLAIESIHSGEQSGRPVSFVVVSHGPAAAFFDRQTGLGAVQRLDLTLFIGAQNQGVFRRVEIETHDGFQLFRELGVVADFEGLHQMRLEAVGMPDTAYARLAQSGRSRHRAGAPMRGIGGSACVVFSITSAVRASLMVRGLPGRGASFSSPCMPPLRYRLRQRAAFSGVIRSSAAICRSWRPALARNTIRARSTRRAGRERPRAACSNASRFSLFSSTGRAMRIRIRPSNCKDAIQLLIVTIYDADH